MKAWKLNLLSRLSSLLLVLLLIVAVSSCGRKGDPVLITPDDKAAAERAAADK